MKIPKRVIIMAVVLILSTCVFVYAAATYLQQFGFDDERALDKWAKMIFKGQVDYRVMKLGEQGFLKAASHKTCSAIYYRLGYKTKDYPILTWKWRVLKFPDKSKATTPKERDDYAARIYVIFPFLSFSSSTFIEYIWDEKLPVGTVMNSPAGKNIKQIVVRSGAIPNSEWATETRNVYEDYTKAFGKSPRLNAGAIAIMCNADNTKSEAAALFDDIIVENETRLKGRVAKQ